jgi:hypothetical protein
VEGEVAFDHPGRRIELPGQERVSALPLVPLDATVAFEPSAEIAARAPELVG